MAHLLAPKRPLSPFVLFCKEARVNLKRDHPDYSSAKIMKLVNKDWKKMGEADKQ